MSSSKSYHHRYLLAGALSILKGDTMRVKISSVGICEDVIATLHVIATMGVDFELLEEGGKYHTVLSKKDFRNEIVHSATKLPNVQQNFVTSISKSQSADSCQEEKKLPNINLCDRKLYNVGESGTTLRLIIPILIAMDEPAVITGRGSIFSRPLDEYLDLFDKKEIHYHYEGLPLELGMNQSDRLAGKIEISTDTSSQFLSGLLFAVPLLRHETKIVLTSPVKSKNYIDITLDVLHHAGIEYKCGNREFVLPPNQKYIMKDTVVEGDYSSACFFIAAGILSKSVKIRGLNPESLQGDRAMVDLLKRANAKIYFEDENLIVHPSQLIGIQIDAEHIIDSVPVLCVLFATAKGKTKIKNVKRLRSKESDRIKSSCEMILNLGGEIEYLEEEDVILIQGVNSLRGGEVNTHHDHRIAMSACIAALISKEDVIIDDYLCVNKSYTDFFEDFARLGGEYVI